MRADSTKTAPSYWPISPGQNVPGAAYWWLSRHEPAPVSARRSCETSGWMPHQYRSPRRPGAALPRSFATMYRMSEDLMLSWAVIVPVLVFELAYRTFVPPEITP